MDNTIKTNIEGWARAKSVDGWQCVDCRKGVHENHSERSGSCSTTKWRNVGRGVREEIFCWCPMRKPRSLNLVGF